MKNCMSAKIVFRAFKNLSPAVKRQLDYMNPKGASNRKLPYSLQRIMLDDSGYHYKSTENLSPVKLPAIESSVHTHSNLIKSTKIIKKLVLTASKDSSPIREEKRNSSKSNLTRVSAIVTSCDQISKINKEDIFLTDTLGKQNKLVFEDAEEFVEQTKLGNDVSRWTYRFQKRKVNQKSIEKIKKESLATSYYVEKVLNRANSTKKIRERIMPWKKIVM